MTTITHESHVTSAVQASWRRTAALTLAALGVVYGDIGTSVLYAFKESFHYVEPTPQNVLGILSLMTWSLIVVVTVKYVIFMLDTNHHGEGGITALIGLVKKRVKPWHIVLGIFGVSLLYGDGIITPAISVLSAVEGLEVITPTAKQFVIPITVTILLGLFSIQRYGTQRVGSAFGPIMTIWFITIATLGLNEIAKHPEVLQAINPLYAFDFFKENGLVGFFTLGAVVLVVTGGEALYADLGHFGSRAVRIGWIGVAFPALLLNYYGQAALVIQDPESAHHPFYSLAPEWFKFPLVVLATMATIIASQALITGAYSLTRQLIDLHALPPLEIFSTSKEHHGQIYIPTVNKLLLFGCVVLVLFFKTSSNLAAAYGIAVTGTMAITTWLWYLTLINVKGWQKKTALSLLVLFVSMDLAFFGANIVKFFHGGWIPLTIATVLTFGMEVFYFRTRRLLAIKKKPMNGTLTNNNCSLAVVFVDEYVHDGTRRLIQKAKDLRMPYKIVHVCTRLERLDILKQYMAELGETVEIVPSPSGDLLRPAEAYVLELQNKECADIWILLGQIVKKGEPEELHPTARSIRRQIQTHPGFTFVQVPWIVEAENLSAPK